jgi:hypothetical protein
MITAVSLVFGALAALSPLAYGMLRKSPDDVLATLPNNNNDTIVGSVAGMLLASSLVLVAAFGELGVTWVISVDGNPLMAHVTFLNVAFDVGLAVVALILLGYSSRSMMWLARYRPSTSASSNVLPSLISPTLASSATL